MTAGDIRLDDLRLGEEDKLDIDKETGRITVINSADYPSLGKNQVRIKYNYGMSSVPNDIKTLAVLMTARQLVYGTEISGKTDEKTVKGFYQKYGKS